MLEEEEKEEEEEEEEEESVTCLKNRAGAPLVNNNPTQLDRIQSSKASFHIRDTMLLIENHIRVSLLKDLALKST